jgi:hypothetical protein
MFLLLLFETRSCYVACTVLKLVIFPTQPPEFPGLQVHTTMPSQFMLLCYNLHLLYCVFLNNYLFLIILIFLVLDIESIVLCMVHKYSTNT